MRTYARTQNGFWLEVKYHDAEGVWASELQSNFDALWRGEGVVRGGVKRLAWHELGLPLENAALPCVAYGLTYPEHRDETSLAAQSIVRFDKSCVATRLGPDMAWRPYLDFEIEVGVLCRRSDPSRFGYCLLMDWTDRGTQVRGFDARSPEKSFAQSKSFANALGVGPLLVVDDGAAWPQIDFSLKLNNRLRQKATAGDCLLEPTRFHAVPPITALDEWLVASGTPAGVLFRAPTVAEKLRLWIKSGFSSKKARELWLSELHFLRPGDVIEVESSQLGRAMVDVGVAMQLL